MELSLHPISRDFQVKYIYIIAVVFLVSFTGYLFAFFLGKLLKYEQDMLVTFTFSGGMRNISAGAVIAISYFPSAVVFPVVVGHAISTNYRIHFCHHSR